MGFDGLLLPERFLSADISYLTPYTKTVSFDTDLDADDQTEANLVSELRTKAQAYLNENKYPKVSYEIESNINQNLNIGDMIHVKHPLVTLLTEVIEYEYNTNTQKIEKLVFGNYVRDVKTKFAEYRESIEKINETASKQEAVISNQTKLINRLGKEGYVYWDENELLIMDNEDKLTATNLWRWNLGGLGFSSNGYEGPFITAMTMDGQINASMITTGKLNVARIEGLAEYKKENLLINSNFSADNSIAKGWGDNGSNGNGFTRELIQANNKTWLHLASTNTSIRWYGISQSGINGKFKSNTKYTVSFLAYGTGNVRIGIHEKLNNSIVEQNWKSIEVSNEIKRYDYTFTTTSNNIDNFNFMVYGQDYGLYNFYITEIKFEEGEYATSWNDNLSDHIRSAINLNPDGVLISGDAIDLTASKVINILAGNTINMTAKNIAFTSTNFSVDANGNLTANNATLNQATIKSGTNAKVEISNGALNTYTANGYTGFEIGGQLMFTHSARNGARNGYIGPYGGTTTDDFAIISLNNYNLYLGAGSWNGSSGSVTPGLKFTTTEIKAYLDIWKEGGGSFMYGIAAHRYRVSWENAQLQFWVDVTNVANLSDKRLKDDILDVDENFIKAIDECKFFQYKAKNRDGLISVGIMAQDLTEKCKEYGVENPLKYEVLNKIKYRLDDEELYYSINYNQLLAFKILALEKRIKKLEKAS